MPQHRIVGATDERHALQAACMATGDPSQNRRRGRWLLVAMALILALLFGRDALKRNLDPRLIGEWEADKDDWSQNVYLLWLDLRSDGTAIETEDSIGELRVGECRWSVENDQLVLHGGVYWNNDGVWENLHRNAGILWEDVLGIPAVSARYRIRSVDESTLELEPIGDARLNQKSTTTLRFHRGKTL